MVRICIRKYILQVYMWSTKKYVDKNLSHFWLYADKHIYIGVGLAEAYPLSWPNFSIQRDFCWCHLPFSPCVAPVGLFFSLVDTTGLAQLSVLLDCLFGGYCKVFVLWSAHSRTILGIGLQCPALKEIGVGGISLIQGDIFGRLTGTYLKPHSLTICLTPESVFPLVPNSESD